MIPLLIYHRKSTILKKVCIYKLHSSILNTIKIPILGVIAHCNMKCDEEPCKNGGTCIEDFRNQEHACNCEHTSYYGEFCNEEKGRLISNVARVALI